MQQEPHVETDVEHTDDQQDTGNHYKPGTPEAGGPDRLGGTRAGAENVERVTHEGPAQVETGAGETPSDLGEVNASERSLRDAAPGEHLSGHDRP